MCDATCVSVGHAPWCADAGDDGDEHACDADFSEGRGCAHNIEQYGPDVCRWFYCPDCDYAHFCDATCERLGLAPWCADNSRAPTRAPVGAPTRAPVGAPTPAPLGGGHHHHASSSDAGLSDGLAVALTVAGVALVALAATCLYARRVSRQVRDMQTRQELGLMGGGGLQAPLFVGEQAAADYVPPHSELPQMPPTSQYVPLRAELGAENDDLDTDSVAGDDLAGDVY